MCCDLAFLGHRTPQFDEKHISYSFGLDLKQHGLKRFGDIFAWILLFSKHCNFSYCAAAMYSLHFTYHWSCHILLGPSPDLNLTLSHVTMAFPRLNSPLFCHVCNVRNGFYKISSFVMSLKQLKKKHIIISYFIFTFNHFHLLLWKPRNTVSSHETKDTVALWWCHFWSVYYCNTGSTNELHIDVYLQHRQ